MKGVWGLAGGEDEAALVAAVAAGDAQAFVRLYDRYADRVYRYCRARLRDGDAAADVCQEVMLALWRGAAAYAANGTVAAWVFGVACRRVADARRRLARHPEEPWDAEADPPPDPAAGEAAAQAEERLDMHAALARLPPAQQDVLLMAYAFGLSCAEIAAAASVPEGTVKSRLYHARRALAREVAG